MFSSNNYVLLRNVCQYVCFKSLAPDRCIIIFRNWLKLIKLYIPRKVSGPRADRRSDPVWWTVSRNYTVLFLSRDVKNTKSINIYRWSWRRFVSNSRFRKLVLFWMWRHHGRAFWRRGGGTWHNGLLLTTASNVNRWADVVNHVTRLWQAGDTGNFERRITGQLWAVSRSRAAQSRDDKW